MANELKIRVIFDTGEAQTNSKKYAESVKYAEGTVGALEAQLRKLKLELKGTIQNTDAHIAKLVEMKAKQAEVNDALGKGVNAYKSTTGATANATMTLQALNYTIRDAPYFARDFSLGLLAVGNNLNPLIDGFIRMKEQLKEGQTLWGALTSSMSKAQIAILGFSALVSIIQAVTFALAKTKDESEQTTKSVNELGDSFKTLEERIRDANNELKNIKATNFRSVFIALQEELKTTTTELDNLIKKKKEYDDLIKGTTSPEEMAAFTFFLLPTIEERKKAEEEFKKDKARYEELLRLGRLLNDARQSIEKGGNLPQFIKNTSQQDLKFVTDTFTQWKDTLNDYNAISFTGLGQRINVTKEEATKLLKEIDKIVNPKDIKAPKKASVWDSILEEFDAKMQAFEERIKASAEISKLIRETFLQGVEMPSTFKELISAMEDYQTGLETIKKSEQSLKEQEEARLVIYEKFISRVAKFNLEVSDSSIEKLMQQQLKDEQRKTSKDDEQKALKAVEQDLKEIERTQNEIDAQASDIGNSLFSAFIQGKKGLDAFLESLALAVAKMLFIKAIASVLGIASGGVTTAASAATSALPGLSGVTAAGGIGVGVNPNVLPTISTGGLTINTGNQQIISSLNALNANLAMLQPQVTVVSNVPGLEFTKQVTNKAQSKLTRGNVVDVV